MRLLRQFQTCLFFFKKKFERKKTLTSKNQLTNKNKRIKETEATFVMCKKTSEGVEIVCFTLGAFCACEIFFFFLNKHV